MLRNTYFYENRMFTNKVSSERGKVRSLEGKEKKSWSKLKKEKV